MVERRTVHLFVFDTLSDWEPGYAIAGINSPAFQPGPGRYVVATVGLTEALVRTAGGLTVLPDTILDRVEPNPARNAMLILPGGSAWDEGQNMEAAETARAFLAAGVPVAAICGATAGLARAGLLDGRRHTSNARGYLEATGYRGADLYQDEPVVSNGDLITAGATAPLEFAREIFRRLGVYEDRTLEGWYGLFKTGDPTYFFNLQAEAGADA